MLQSQVHLVEVLAELEHLFDLHFGESIATRALLLLLGSSLLPGPFESILRHEISE